MLGEEALERGRTPFEGTEESWKQIIATRPVRSEIPPCPPVAFVDAEAPIDDADEEWISPGRAVAIAAGLTAIVALGAFLVVGGQSARSGVTPSEGLPGSAEVGRVTAPDRVDDSTRPPASGPRQHQAGTGPGKHGPKNSSSGHGGQNGSGNSGGGGSGGGSGGGEKPQPLVTVNAPVIGTVTVDAPELPPLPDVKETVPDVPDSPVPDVELP